MRLLPTLRRPRTPLRRPLRIPRRPAPQFETVTMTGPADVHQANTVAQWTVAPQNTDPSYLNDVLKAIQSQSVSGNPALSSLA